MPFNLAILILCLLCENDKMTGVQDTHFDKLSSLTEFVCHQFVKNVTPVCE